ncbi:hypothetical protein C1645_734027 [Glomus cerebriforme]|uniref:Galactose oxidase n=1 Tax=Glomus cerebriforme TaxID=658196 RepID=A0A397TG34_9GLOM|nr:hypothetical protein C1645_734027 [Glomus cerebriforme]
MKTMIDSISSFSWQMNKNFYSFKIWKTISDIQLFLSVVHGQTGQYIPASRVGQTSVSSGDKIYYIGGVYISAGGPEKTWVDLKGQGVKIPLLAWHTANTGGINQDLIFIIGGDRLFNDNILVYQFDTKTNVISIPIIQGITPSRRSDVNSVSFGGKIYLFSGYSTDNSNTLVNSFDILNTLTLNWEVGSLVNAPLPRYKYTATLVNNVIYYIGGLQKNGLGQDYSPMSDIYQYDIVGDAWSLKTATTTGIMPGFRSDHSAVLIDGKICIFGGTVKTANMLYAMPPVVPIAMLDTSTLTWSTPPLKDPNVPKLAYHSATLIDKIMLLAFGNNTDVPGGIFNNRFYLFDLGDPNFPWYTLTAQELVTVANSNTPKTPNTPNAPNASIPPFNIPTTPTTKSTASDTKQQQPSSNNMLVFGLSIGLGVIGLGTVVAFLFLYRRMKKNQTERGEIDYSGGPDTPEVILQIPSSVDKNNPTYQPTNQFESVTPTPPYFINSNSQRTYSPTPTLTQSQRYSLSQEFSTLPLPQQGRFSNYSLGSGTLSYFSGSENPPPPPPKD